MNIAIALWWYPDHATRTAAHKIADHCTFSIVLWWNLSGTAAPQTLPDLGQVFFFTYSTKQHENTAAETQVPFTSPQHATTSPFEWW